MRTVATAMLCFLAGAACSSAPEVEERPPDAFGWVIDWKRSPDYQFDVREGVTAGSVELTLEDGTRFSVLASTEISNYTCEPVEVYGPVDRPCWVHVGLSSDRASALWLTPFWVQGWTTPVPGEVPVADRVLTNHRVAAEHDDRLVLVDGTVLPFDRNRVEVSILGTAPSLDDALGRLARLGLCDIIVDQQTGAVTKLDCRLPY